MRLNGARLDGNSRPGPIGLRRPGAVLALAAVLLLPSCLDSAARGGSARPNYLLVTADDMSAEDCEPCGQPRLRTPNLARLAAEGMQFTRAFVTSGSCSPSRCSTLTGRYPHAAGAGHLHDPLPADQVTFLEGLRQAGYYTALAGKWHLGKKAFNRFDRVYRESERGGSEKWLACLRDRPRGRPFFIWLSASDPHRPYADGTVEKPHAPQDVVVPPFLPDVTETRLDLARADRWTLDVGASRSIAGDRLRVAAATHFFSSLKTNDPSQDLYAGVEARLWNGWVSSRGDRAVVKGRYGIAFGHGFTADHQLGIGAELSKIVAVDLLLAREGSYGNGASWRPVGGLRLGIGKYRVTLARDAGINDLGSAYRVGVDVCFP